MGVLESLSLAVGVAWTAGINLYATVAILGLAGKYEMIQLPPELAILMHPMVIVVACTMYIIEFFADKIPYVDNGWDAIHTFIRIPAGAVLAARAVTKSGCETQRPMAGSNMLTIRARWDQMTVLNQQVPSTSDSTKGGVRIKRIMIWSRLV